MTQTEFLDILRKALNGQVSSQTVSDNINYYRSYITDELRKGRREEDILEELGDPRLIARTIIDVDEKSGGSRKKSYSPFGSDSNDSDSCGPVFRDESAELQRHSFHISKWMVLGIVFLILLIIFSVIFFVFKAAFSLLFSFKGLWFWAILLLIIYSLSRPRRK